MKKFALWMSALLLLGIVGCGAPAEETVTYTVETELREEEIFAGDGTKLAEIRNAIPVLWAKDGDGAPIVDAVGDLQKRALEVTAAFNEGFDYWRHSDELAQSAKEAYQYTPELFKSGTLYAEELTYTVWQTEKLVSIRGTAYANYGGAHPNVALTAWNFDLENGAYLMDPLAWGRDAEEFRTAVAEELVKMADARAAEWGEAPTVTYWEDYREILQYWGSGAVSFDAAGMTVSFSPYHLGPYAIGAQEFLVGYDFLNPYLSDSAKDLLGLTD